MMLIFFTYINLDTIMKSLIIPMKSVSSAQRDNVLVLSSYCLSTRQIAAKTGFSKATIARVIKKVFPNKENIKMGRPSKLTPHDKRAIIHHVLSGETSTAVQATNLINSIIPTHVSTQTVRNTLKAANLKAATKKKKPLLSPAHRKKRLAFALSISIGPHPIDLVLI